jgi:hypothetical protein
VGIGPPDALAVAIEVVAGGLLALLLWRWYSAGETEPSVGDDVWTRGLAILALIVWLFVGARLFGLV